MGDTAELVITDKDGKEQRTQFITSKFDGIIQGLHNVDDSIKFAQLV